MRTFVAIAMPDPVRDALEALQGDLPVGRAMRRDTLHLTLAFLGDREPSDLEELDAGLAALRAPGFALRLAGLGTFGSRSPTVLWAGVDAEPALVDLRRKIRGAARQAGIALPHERFRPHVTVARFRNRLHADELAQIGWFQERNGDFSTAPFPAGGFTLFRSRLGADGAEHEPLADYPLIGPDVPLRQDSDEGP